QDTFVSVWRSAASFRPPAAAGAAGTAGPTTAGPTGPTTGPTGPTGPPTGDVGAGGWLWSIALRRLVDHLRRRPHPTPLATIPEPEPLPPPGTAHYDLLSRMPAELHSVVAAVYLDGLTTAEAGVLLGIPQGTVKSRLARAKPLLQEVLR
ncbi:MAG: RNA polymerase sigma factor, partial [Actinomycetota bacterium]|nr:RNA polymerase sigma factor [Actinomycetota bacterium]